MGGVESTVQIEEEIMRTIIASVLFLLLCAGCGDSRREMREMLDQMAAKPAATETGNQKALYDEVSKLLAWIEAHPEDSTPEMIAQARALRDKRGLEIVEVVGGKVLEGVEKALGKIFSDDGKSAVKIGKIPGKTADWILGVNDLRMKQFGCPETMIVEGVEVPFDITKDGASRLCP